MRLVKPLFIEPLVPFSHWSGQSVLDPHYEGLGYDGPLSSKLLKSRSHKHDLHYQYLQQT
jgi:hypothetical protein